MSSMKFIMTDESINLITPNGPKTVLKSSDEELYTEVKEAIKADNWDKVVSLTDLIGKIRTYTESYSDGEITVENGIVKYNEVELHGYVIDKILQFAKENIPIKSLVNFVKKLMSNPSKRCVDELYGFLEQKNMPLDEDGDFYAYKAVRSDWTDKYTGKIDNSIGAVIPRKKRNEVNDDSSIGCAEGYHAGSIEYVRSFGSGDDKYIIVKINPKDVVSVPKEDHRKLRCCYYEVIEEFVDVLPDTVYSTNNSNEYDWEDEINDDLLDEEYEEMINLFETEEDILEAPEIIIPTDKEIDCMGREEIIDYLEVLEIAYSRKRSTPELRTKLKKAINKE